MQGRPVACAVAVALCGCSFVAVRRPPQSPPPPGAPLECTQSRVAPAFDTVGAILVPLVGLSAAAVCELEQSQQSWASEPMDLHCGNIVWATAGVTAAYVASAIYGFHETGACRRVAARPPLSSVAPGRPLPAHLAPTPPN
jgi:hypothetical protein